MADYKPQETDKRRWFVQFDISARGGTGACGVDHFLLTPGGGFLGK